VVVDEISTVAALFLVVVGLGNRLVGEELVFGKVEDQAEARLVKVLHADVVQVLQSSFVAVGDGLCEGGILHGRQPELGNTFGIVVGCVCWLVRSLLLGVFVVLVLIVLLTSLNLLLTWLARTVDDGGTLFVEWAVFGEELLLQSQDLLLEFGLKLRVLLLNTLEASYSLADRSR